MKIFPSSEAIGIWDFEADEKVFLFSRGTKLYGS